MEYLKYAFYVILALAALRIIVILVQSSIASKNKKSFEKKRDTSMREFIKPQFDSNLKDIAWKITVFRLGKNPDIILRNYDGTKYLFRDNVDNDRFFEENVMLNEFEWVFGYKKEVIERVYLFQKSQFNEYIIKNKATLLEQEVVTQDEYNDLKEFLTLKEKEVITYQFLRTTFQEYQNTDIWTLSS